MMLALCLGTMGLLHVLVRFDTNADGVAARRTTVSVVALLAIFCLWPPVHAVLGRLHLPSLPPGARSDTIVIQLPARVVDGLGADLLTAMLAGGDAFGFGGFRLVAVAAVAVPFVAARFVEQIGIATTVGFAFSLAAATFAPLLILGVWWKGLSRAGAVAGPVVGALAATSAAVTTYAAGPLDGWAGALLANPVASHTPLAFATAILVSLATQPPPPVTRQGSWSASTPPKRSTSPKGASANRPFGEPMVSERSPIEGRRSRCARQG
ncbi:putative transporter [Janibacter sp. HTCC2649]|uniref:sodium:solute symporter family transporter n=1 Tax=Janibacter sp. HTCC2649 TaxID=313589 RepID=UPI0000670BDA|nr:putative transporter [Janibacter sp. HTCC2649]EAQ00466.1 putative transporter [Janibacter sp. HTCC2649]